MPRVSLKGADGSPFRLRKGAHPSVVAVLDEFCPRWMPGARVVSINCSGGPIVFGREFLLDFGVEVRNPDLLPSVVVYHDANRWLVLIEAVTSHGPVNPKRHQELKELFSHANIGLVFVTAFLDRKTLTKYLGDIAWETEVWVADAPTHLIHFNGVRFLGPY